MYDLYAALHFNHKLFIGSFGSTEEAVEYAVLTVKRLKIPRGCYVIKSNNPPDVPEHCREILVWEDGTVSDASDQEMRES